MLVWIDLETTGLDPGNDLILEVACVITDDAFTEISRFNHVTDAARWMKIGDLKPVVYAMHTANGLLKESLDRGARGEHFCNERSAMYDLYNFINDNTLMIEDVSALVDNSALPQLAGSTVYFDRAFLNKALPTMMGLLHHRVLDVSTINEMARRVWPAIHAARPKSRELHRAMPDIEDSIATAKYYATVLGPIA